MRPKVSFSRVDLWRQCPYKYKLRYIDGIPEEPDFSPTNARLLGSTLDLGIQKGYDEAEKYYWSQLPVASNAGYTELMKIEHWLPQLRSKFNKGRFQVRIQTDRFLGFADYIEDDRLLVDFKYSNAVEKYAESAQLHVYASELDPKPDYLAYVCIPKTSIRQRRDEDLREFRNRVQDTLDGMEIQTIWVDYDREKVEEFWSDAGEMLNATEFEPRRNDYCKWCDYAHLCPLQNPEPPKASGERRFKPRTEIKF